MATYTLDQQIYSFSFSQNSAFGLSFAASDSQTAAQVMQAYVTKVSQDILSDTTIQGLIGTDWVSVWGPIVWADVTDTPTVHADNTMGCFYSPSQQLFIIGIAGTNGNSPYGWLTEDLDVKSQVEWSSISPGADSKAGYIAEGSSTGLNVLLNIMTDNGSGLMAALLAYTENLKNNGTTRVSIAISGHSLGGALAPTLALYMSDNHNQWDSYGNTAITCMPTAGPSPGNSTWAAYYEQSGIIYNAQYNSIDVVPHAWQSSYMSEIPQLYISNITPAAGSPANPIIGSLTAALCAYSKSNGFDSIFYPYTQVTPFNPMTGTFDTATDNTVTNTYNVSEIELILPASLQDYVQVFVNFARFVYQMLYQHTTAYQSLLNISDFMAEYAIILSKDKPATAVALPDHGDVIIKRFTGFDPKYFNTENISRLAAQKH